MPLAAAFVLVAATGCGTVRHNLDLQEGYMPKARSPVEVGEISNETGKDFGYAIEDLLRDALARALSDEELLRSGSKELSLMTNCRILTYEEGNAVKRWLFPGWGPTVLSVRCDLLDSGRVVGSLAALRTVDFGGMYTLGAGGMVFSQVARDIARDIKDVIP
jgi:hypothetical protein